MRVLVVSTTGTATSTADLWRSAVPTASTDPVPFSDGRTGFLDALAGIARPWNVPATVGRGPVVSDTGHDVVFRRVDGPSATVYVDVAGLTSRAVSEARTSDEVGRLLRALADPLARVGRVVLAVGGGRGGDGGAGMIEVLAEGVPTGAPPQAVLEAARSVVRGIDLVAATDVDIPLLGLHGASAASRDQGVDAVVAQDAERRLGAFAHEMDVAAGRLDAGRTTILATSGSRQRPSAIPGVGAGGGLAYGIALLGGRVLPAVRVLADAVDLDARIAVADLVVVVTNRLGASEMTALVPELAGRANTLGVPNVWLVQEAVAGRREWSIAGIDGVHVVDGDPSVAVRRVARTWSAARRS